MTKKFEYWKLEIVWKLVLGIWDLAFLYQSHLVEGFSCRDHWVNILLRIDDKIDHHRFGK